MQAGKQGFQLPGQQCYCYTIHWTYGSENNTAVSQLSETELRNYSSSSLSIHFCVGLGGDHKNSSEPPEDIALLLQGGGM